jgi:hypothetical protein
MNTIKLTDQELDIVMRALIQQPYAAVAALVTNITRQVNDAKSPPPVVAPPAAPAK